MKLEIKTEEEIRKPCKKRPYLPNTTWIREESFNILADWIINREGEIEDGIEDFVYLKPYLDFFKRRRQALGGEEK